MFSLSDFIFKIEKTLKHRREITRMSNWVRLVGAANQS